MTEEGKTVVEYVDDIISVGSENENVEEYSNKTGNNMLVGDGATEPEVGMKFNDENQVFEFYKRYAYEIGFPVRKRNTRKDDDGVLRHMTLVCSREGKRIGNTRGSFHPQATIQSGCKARITATTDMCGIWRINKVYLEHNHKTSPSKSRLYRCNRELSAHVKRRLEVNDMAGIPLHKSYNSTVVEAGGYEHLTFIEKDCRNYVEKVRRLKIEHGDAAAIQAYFSKMQAQSPGFYFTIDLDDELRMRNIFWADNRSRQAYKEFGDVVTFDTTYLVNKYDMPFAPFVGVNHHGQSTLLGCGLVSNEDTETFVWLFRAWLQCMGHAPHGIITDQDRAMKNAIQIVFPNTKHRWCLWHIMKKLPEKFGNHVDKSSIFSNLHVLVYDCQFAEEFENGWRVMLEKFKLYDNDWLAGLYENRERWVPCYLKTTFWAGMSTTQRSESMNAFFDGYVHSKTTLTQFVEQYERALRNKVEKEFQADFKSFSQMVPCATRYEMEKQFQATYTISKFKEIQEEFTGKVYCDLIYVSEGLSGMNYEIREDVMYDEHSKKKTFFVSYEKEKSEITCSCHNFEFRGIICRHSIAVLIRNDVKSVPERYILRRWRRDVSRAHTRVAVTYAGLVSTAGQLKYEKMCQRFATLADLTAEDEVNSDAIIDWIDNKCEQMMTLRSSSNSNILTSHTSQMSSACGASHDIGSIRDPECVRRKGAPKKLRKKSALESTSKRVKATSTKAKGKKSMVDTSTIGCEAANVPSSQHLQMMLPFSYTHLLMGGHESHQLTQNVQPTCVNPPTPASVTFNMQENGPCIPLKTPTYELPQFGFSFGNPETQ